MNRKIKQEWKDLATRTDEKEHFNSEYDGAMLYHTKV